jgi:diguanylate cyclase (GGDEF)-like protein
MHPTDHVTGLALRSELQTRLERLSADAGTFALVICDVVGLKGVNEREGFLAGDACLRRAADRLRAATAAADLVARLGGDELVGVFVGPEASVEAGRAASVLAGPGTPPLRAAAVNAVDGEGLGPLVDRLYATMRQS